jgi:hypothetical protein
MLDNPRVNFAISQRAGEPGVNHLGLQVESGEELVAMRDQLQRADAALLEERAARCCYATSDKYWITDPQGVAWETFRSLSSIPVYGEERQTADTCCVPEASAKSEVACCSGAC